MQNRIKWTSRLTDGLVRRWLSDSGYRKDTSVCRCPWRYRVFWPNCKSPPRNSTPAHSFPWGFGIGGFPATALIGEGGEGADSIPSMAIIACWFKSSIGSWRQTEIERKEIRVWKTVNCSETVSFKLIACMPIGISVRIPTADRQLSFPRRTPVKLTINAHVSKTLVPIDTPYILPIGTTLPYINADPIYPHSKNPP